MAVPEGELAAGVELVAAESRFLASATAPEAAGLANGAARAVLVVAP